MTPVLDAIHLMFRIQSTIPYRDICDYTGKSFKEVIDVLVENSEHLHPAGSGAVTGFNNNAAIKKMLQVGRWYYKTSIYWNPEKTNGYSLENNYAAMEILDTQAYRDKIGEHWYDLVMFNGTHPQAFPRHDLEVLVHVENEPILQSLGMICEGAIAQVWQE